MESIRIKNFRSLQDTGTIHLKPITILVGKNSAGKSTFLRTFPLFKQSVEERTNSPILLYNRNGVDFGSYKDVKSIFAKKEDSLEFEFTLSNITLARGFRYSFGEEIESDLKISIQIHSNTEESPVLSSLKLYFFDNTVSINFDYKDKTITDIIINNQALEIDSKISYFTRGLIPDRLIFRETREHGDIEDYAENKLITLIKKKSRKGTSEDKITSIIRHSFILGDKEDVLNKLKSIKNNVTWVKKIKDMDTSSPYFKEIYQLIILQNLQSILNAANTHLKETFHRVKYIAPVRATAERYYRMQDLSIEEVDPSGQNLAMFLRSLTPTMMRRFQLWTEENFDFKVRVPKSEGHVSIKIVYKNNFEVNISDMGFGYSQILPIITQLWYSTEKRGLMSPRYRNISTFFVIEQPELHLHPEFQAKFADVIVKVINGIREKNINIKLIIETHSQTIINRLGLNISNNLIEKDNINIIIFNKENEGEATKIVTSNFDEDGLLENWPIGFFKPTSLQGK